MVAQTQILIPDDKTLYISLKEKIQKINHLKFALYIEKDTEFNEEVIDKIIYQQNLKNIMLLKLLVNTIFLCDKRIKNEFIKIAKLYEKPKEYKRELARIKQKFCKNKIYKNFASRFTVKYLDGVDECKYMNFMIYEFAKNYINKDIMLLKNRPYLNIHFLYRWFNDNNYFPIDILDPFEINIINVIASQASLTDLFESELFKKYGRSFIEYSIHMRLPAKCNVENILQVMALNFKNSEKIVNGSN